ncbi:MAG: alpha-N-arabinofuranosidase [Acidobacteriia bacterium]|nr:alpha-N-arabinofuranosidase [Terriglobia bacterium]
MSKNPFLLVTLVAGLTASAGAQTAAPEKKLTMTVEAAKTGAPIDRYVYGQFTELLFNLFEKGLWAEMLSDRKFFYPVDSSAKLVPENRKRNFTRWRPVGPDEFVVMDAKNPYVGEHAPLVKLDATAPHGIRQAGLPLRQGREYSGHVVLMGDPGAKVQVSLVWGAGPNDRQTIPIPALSPAYTRFPLRFTAGANSEDAALEITGTGQGSFHIGIVSLMPAENIDGFRADMIKLLQEVDWGIYRWPGGNFVSGYDWRDGIGDRDSRPPRYDYAWHTVEYNDVGTDEFVTLCRLLKIDPYICVNSGFGDAYSAARWVEYCNGSAGTPMGKLRAANGHPEPYRVKWWGIGNEMYGEWQLGHMYIDHYVIKHNMFGQAMRAVDPTILLVACGATPFETSTVARLHRLPLPAKLPYQFGSPQDWSGQLLEHSSDYIDFLSEHLYPLLDSAFDVGTQKFVKTNDPLEDQMRRLPNRVQATAEAWNEYLQRMPQLRDKNIKLAIDEWAGGGFRGFMRALCAAEGLQEMFRHSDIIKMGAYTAFTASIAFNGNDATFSPVGLVFKLYQHHFGTFPVAVSGNSPQKSVSGTVGVDKPQVASGSDTYPLDVAAALTKDGKTLTVAVVNPTQAPHAIDFNVAGVQLRGPGKVYRIVAPRLEAENEPGKKPEIETVEMAVPEVPATLEAAPLSVNLYEFAAR